MKPPERSLLDVLVSRYDPTALCGQGPIPVPDSPWSDCAARRSPTGPLPLRLEPSQQSPSSRETLGKAPSSSRRSGLTLEPSTPHRMNAPPTTLFRGGAFVWAGVQVRGGALNAPGDDDGRGASYSIFFQVRRNARSCFDSSASSRAERMPKVKVARPSSSAAS